MHNDPAFLSLLIMSLLAFIVPLALSHIPRVAIPVVIGEILVGLVIGKSGFDIIANSPIIDFLAEFGFVFLMFVSGLEVNLETLFSAGGGTIRKSLKNNFLLVGITTFVLTLSASLGYAILLKNMGLIESPFIIALILSTTSLGIVVPVLKEKGIVTSDYGQMILVTALIADFATLILLTITFGILRQGIVLQIVLLLVLLALFGFAFKVIAFVGNIPRLKKWVEELSSATTQIRIRGSIALMVVWVSLAQLLGVEIILGAFLAGVLAGVIVGHEEKSFREKLDAIGYGFFIPLFFIMVGVRMHLPVLFQNRDALYLFPLFIIGAYVVKLIPVCIFRLSVSWKSSIAAGFLLSSRLSLIIAASALAFQLNLISEGINADFILAAVVTCTLSPMLFNKFAPETKEVQRQGIIVVGLNHLTSLLVERLHEEGETVTVLGCPADGMDKPYCRINGALHTDDINEEALKQAGAENAEALVTAMADASLNIHVCSLAVKQFDIPVVIARADDRDAMEKLKEMGVRVIQPAQATSIALEGALRYPAAFDMIANHKDNTDLIEARLVNASLSGKALRDITLPGNVLVMGIRRMGEIIVPHGDTTLRRDDHVMLVGSHEYVKQVKNLMERG